MMLETLTVQEEQKINQALPTLNCYRNRFYNAPSGTEEYELANAINDILPLLSRLIK